MAIDSRLPSKNTKTIAQRLRERANDAECWSESYEGQRQAGWLMDFADLMREAADELDRRPERAK